MDNRPIGVFDSGLGGLTAVKKLMEVLPNMDDQPVEEKTGDEKGIELLLYGCDFIKHCKNYFRAVTDTHSP